MTNPHLATSTWSLHRTLDRGQATLLDLPAQAAAHGIGRLEICHFHIASTDSGYLNDLRGALDDAGVRFFTLLIDSGDISHPDPDRRAQEIAMISDWINVAAACGAERARVIAGSQPPDGKGEVLRRSEAALAQLVQRAHDVGVRLVTENWHALLARPAEVLDLVDRMEGRLGLLVDFGNWKGPTKYDDLARILPYASSTHAKAEYPEAGQMNKADFTRCLDLCRQAGFFGPHSLIFDGPGEEWPSLDEMQEVLRPYLTGAA